MRQARVFSTGLAVLVAGWVGSTGCTNYYYGGAPGPICGPPLLPAPVRYGSVCDVPPTQVSGGTLVSDGPRTVGGRPPREIVSEPDTSRLPWRRSNPDAGVATKVEGNIDDPSLTR